MVVKSTGPDSKLLILTDQQRKRAGEVAEKFDVAALIYNIAALQKLRWAVRNSDTSRALLEASLLRFALNEHFLNVDELLSQLKGGSPAAVTGKKKVQHIVNSPPATVQQAAIPQSKNAQSIKDNWQETLRLIKTKLGPGTNGFLSSALPTQFDQGVLTLEFDMSGRADIFEKSGRKEQIEALLSKEFSTPIKLKVETAAGVQSKSDSGATPPKTGSQRRNEIVSDPAVRTILMGLDATITGIEETVE